MTSLHHIVDLVLAFEGLYLVLYVCGRLTEITIFKYIFLLFISLFSYLEKVAHRHKKYKHVYNRAHITTRDEQKHWYGYKYQ